MRVIVAGSRTFSDAALIDKVLSRYKITVLVHGACPNGADKLVEKWGHNRFYTDVNREIRPMRIERFPADWGKFGPAAGPIRNERMAKAGADRCIGFFDDGLCKGTKNMLRLAERYGIVTEYHGEGAAKARTLRLF